MLGGSRLWEADTKTPVHRLLEGYTAGYLTGAACLMSVYVAARDFMATFDWLPLCYYLRVHNRLFSKLPKRGGDTI
jgi:hypothetical protein